MMIITGKNLTLFAMKIWIRIFYDAGTQFDKGGLPMIVLIVCSSILLPITAKMHARSTKFVAAEACYYAVKRVRGNLNSPDSYG